MINNQTSQKRRWKLSVALFALFALMFAGPNQNHLWAQDVAATISTRETYVGMPVVLKVVISNASEYKPPVLFEVDGCKVESGGSPATSSQITIFNGRRSEKRTVTMQYFITPLGEGEFEIPELTVVVDGKTRIIKRQNIVATKSETGDLMFVEIEGSKERVFVGEPLGRKLKVWLKPFKDVKNQISLNESQMWQMISKQTSWGKFQERIEEMASTRTRPQGKEVQRDNGEGEKQGYFLYEVDSTIYPDRPGTIDGSDVQVVANYPVKLGRSRGPFGSLMDDNGRMSYRSAIMKQMMQDSFFGGSSFGGGLAVTKSRPIVGDAKVDSAEVVPVPTEGRPSDYRGAVGQYTIVSEAEPKTVEAGDPITLQLGVIGDGAMKLVQAPPLNEIEVLTNDFKVTDQALAGFAQRRSKIFATTIRPRRAGITAIPAIPFSFFDPDKEEYVTVYSNPISISVIEAESLSLDSIVSKSGPIKPEVSKAENENVALAPNFENVYSDSMLVSRATSSQFPYWYFVVIPPCVWLMLVICRLMGLVKLPSLRSASSRALSQCDKARTPDDLVEALVGFIGKRTGSDSLTPKQSIGTLRLLGISAEANDTESFFNRMQNSIINGASSDQTSEFGEFITEAKRIASVLDREILENKRGSIRRRESERNDQRNRHTSVAGKGKLVVFVFALFAFSPVGTSLHAKPQTEPEAPVELRASNQHLQTILDDAKRDYELAREAMKDDAASAKDHFSESARKFRLLTEEGVNNPHVHVCAGNAFFQSGETGQAIASFNRALKLDPGNSQAQTNLRFAKSKLKSKDSDEQSDLDMFGFETTTTWLSAAVQSGIRWTGVYAIQIFVAISSLVFWTILIIQTFGWKPKGGMSLLSLAFIPLLILLLSGGILWLNEEASKARIAIVVANDLDVREGDGEEFSTTTTISEAEGTEVRIISQREDWIQIEASKKRIGWVTSADVEELD